jgi:serine phosphatase RsbU (regulator of sigma subunit)
VIIFSLFKLNRSKRIISIQKLKVEEQKQLIEQKHTEITDSINYAERIQRSFLATSELLNDNLQEYFILFKPKDIVSGDFYWAASARIPDRDQNLFYLCTADSTGHGVPGAIMSLLNITSLEKAIEQNIKPTEILNSTRKTIIERLKNDGSAEGGKDGMDCSICAFDFNKMKLQIAAANNPVWLIRRNEVVEIKPDKMPVGKHDKQDVPFTLHEISLQKGDVVYTLTDGFPDQFGGEKGKKFKIKNLRELLAQNVNLSMHAQKELLERTFIEWKGDLEQVDDVTIIGVRV